MAKRAAGYQLTEDNWDDSDASPEPGTFTSADSDTLKQRPMLKAKRRCTAENEGSAKSGAFAGFTGLTRATKTTDFSEQHPRTASSSQSFGIYVQSLNEDLMKRLQDCLAVDPAADVRQIVSDYISKVDRLLPVDISLSGSASSMAAVTSSTTSVTAVADSQTSLVPLSELFSRPSDSWTCTTCLISNKNSDDTCVACMSKRPSSSQQSSQSEVSVTSSLPTLSELFKKTPGEWDCTDCCITNKKDQDSCAACGAAKPANSQPRSSGASVAVSSISAPAPLLSTGFNFRPPLSLPSGSGNGIAAAGNFPVPSSFTFRQPATAGSSVPTSQPEVSTSSQSTLYDMFKPKPGEWSCNVCFVRNKQDSKKCAACCAANPANSQQESSDASVVSLTPASTFTTSRFTFGRPSSDASVVSFSPASSFATTGFTFGRPASDASVVSFTPASSFASTGFTFGRPASDASSIAPASLSTGITFSAPQSTSGSGFSFSPASSFATTGFTFGRPASAANSSLTRAEGTEDNQKDEESEYSPPKPDPVSHTEEGAVYTVRCKLFYMKDGSWVDRGTCNLYLKPCDDKTQLIVRADTCTGTILLNIFLSSDIPFRREDNNNISLACIPNPPIDNQKSKKPVCMLLRVKTSEIADQLLNEINKYQS